MLKYELKKLLINQYVLLFIPFVFFLEFVFLFSAYKETGFENEVTKHFYNEYMLIMNGKLNSEKEEFIKSEMKAVLKSQAKLSEIQNKLISGEYLDENEYLYEYLKIKPYLEKSDAVNKIYNQYKYASQNIESRYIISNNTDGFLRDYPDMIMLIFIVSITSSFFLKENHTGMIDLIRVYGSSKKSIFFSKNAIVLITIILLHLIISIYELCFFSKRIGIDGLTYPIQSIEYFANCEYNISIIKGFIFIQIIKLLGYFFIAILTIFLSVIFKNNIIATSFPLTICILQQFLFITPDKAYYFPTGLLRAIGYFRGNSYTIETTKMEEFTGVSKYTFIIVISSTLICAVLFEIICLSYYKCSHLSKYIKKMLPLILSLCIFTSCSKNFTQSNTEKIYFNLRDSGMFTQNDDYYFTNVIKLDSDGKVISSTLTAFEKKDMDSFNVIRDPFDEDTFIGQYCVVGRNLYFMRYLDIKGFDICKVSLDNFEMDNVFKQSFFCEPMFLGLIMKDSIVIDKTVLKFFTDEKNLFLITSDNEVYQGDCSLNNLNCIIYDGIYQNNLIFDGETIYYINLNLELKAYNIYTKEFKIISSNFVKTFDLNNNKLIYSNNEGIFSINLSDNTLEKISESNATAISVFNDKIVYYQNEKLFLLENYDFKEIYNGKVVHFSFLTNSNVLWCKISKNESLDDILLEIN